MLLEHPDYFAEVFRKRIARAENVQLFLDEEPGLVSDWLLCIADINNAPGERNFLDGRAKGARQADRLDDHVRTNPPVKLGKLRMQIVAVGVDQVGRAGLAGDLQLGVVDVDANGASAAKARSRDCAQSNAAAADDRDRVAGW
jgi:hypothetical protein